jgi:Tol biopolymer transport system component
VRRLFVCLICCLLAAGCTASDERSPKRPVVQRIAYSKALPRNELGVWVSRLDGTGKRLLAKGTSSMISPDGRWVAFQGGRSFNDLMLIATSGGRPRLLVRGAGQPVWSPDSKRLAVLQRLVEERKALLSIAIETGKSMTVDRGSISHVSFSARGDEVAYARGVVFGKVDVFIAGVDGNGKRRVTDNGASAYPIWGPREIAFARIVPYRGWGAHEIWLVRPDGSGRRLLTKTPRALLGSGIVGLVPVAWSADGRALVAALANEFGGIPYAVDPQTGSVRRIGDYSYGAWPQGLSRDGRFVLVSESSYGVPDRSRIEVVPYAGGAGRMIVRHAGEASWNR